MLIEQRKSIPPLPRQVENTDHQRNKRCEIIEIASLHRPVIQMSDVQNIEQEHRYFQQHRNKHKAAKFHANSPAACKQVKSKQKGSEKDRNIRNNIPCIRAAVIHRMNKERIALDDHEKHQEIFCHID